MATTSHVEHELLSKLIDELKVKANSDPEADVLAGRLLHRLKAESVTHTVAEYLEVFSDKFYDEEFFQMHRDELETRVSAFAQSPAYERIVSSGYLSALRYYDTYLYVGRSGKQESVQHFYMRLAGFCASTTCLYAGLRAALQRARPEIESDMEVFDYYFEHLTSQTVCCSTPFMRFAGVENSTLASCILTTPDLSSEWDVTQALYRHLGRYLFQRAGVGVGVTGAGQDGKHISLLMRMINSHVEYHNYGCKRPVSVAAYMEPWHSQIFKFLETKLPENHERCPGIFTGLFVPELFFKLFRDTPWSDWYLFDPKDAGDLERLYGEEFEREYYRLVTAGKFCGRVSIKSLMFSIVNCAVKAGSPFILLKEACNAHFWRDLQGEAMNAANLCAEVLQPSRKSVATCNLANICLPRCLVNAPLAVRAQRADTQGDELLLALPRLSVTLPGEGAVGDGFSLARLRDATQCATFVVACSILQGSPTYDSRDMASMGLGVQGLADVFADLGWQYTDPPSRSLNKEIFEHMYFTALCTSSLIGLHTRKIFPGFKQSKYAGGWFHWHDWAGTDLSIPREIWSRLSERIVRDGLFNSQFIALMPTSGCAQVTGCSDAFYPFYANASTKVTNKEEALRPNRSFWRHVRLDDREALNLVGGRVSCLPEALRQRYLRFQTAFDYNQEDLIQMSRDRAPFVDQSQSHSLFLREEDAARASTLANLLVRSYELGLKTIMYYCRIEKAADLGVMECKASAALSVPREEQNERSPAEQMPPRPMEPAQVARPVDIMSKGPGEGPGGWCVPGGLEVCYKYRQLFSEDDLLETDGFTERACESCQ
uniref:Ribonucleoside-diphosphate reductase large subunit n=1 Tax=Epstein-Barr virus (strain GD1) TaxID=10376 RepID=A0A410IAZ2_EBVG|nr:BORF2 [human gammaherpesvirus 4]